MKQVLVLTLCGFMITLGCQPITAKNSISGLVVDEADQPVPGAVVRIKGTDKFTNSANGGEFSINGLETDAPVYVTAWSQGYFNGGGDTEVAPGITDLKIVLKKHADADNPEYEWVSAFIHGGTKSANCENCHSRADDSNDPQEDHFPFDEWKQDAHALASQNPRFVSMYLGQDLKGNQSAPTRYGFSRDYGRFPLRPDPNTLYYGPGYKLDFPETAGNCAACHTPAAAIDAPYETNPTSLEGVGTEGITCDFCHKIWDVRLNAQTGLPMANMPGVLAFEYRRPPEGHQFFAGPYDDVAPFEDTFSPLQIQSQLCAPCHFGQFWDTQIYNSFGEWLASPYSHKDTGKTCQDCHMPAGKADHFARTSVGGMQRDPMTIFSHLMPGASDPNLLNNAVKLEVNTNIRGNTILVEVTVANDRTGHHVPTDSPLREMILLVEAVDVAGNALPLLSGQTIPEWGGVGDPAEGYYAGQPGKIYSKVLRELWTDVYPTAAYWNPTTVVSDNRLAALASDVTRYTFEKASDGMVSINVSLRLRRAFKELMIQKGWDVDDIIMEQESIFLSDK